MFRRVTRQPILKHIWTYSAFSTFNAAKLNHLYIPSNNNNESCLNLIVLHGLLGSSSNFRGIVSNQKISSLANSYLLDLRNHGSSEHRDTMTSEEMARDVRNFLDENNIHSNVVIMGHSMGARVAMTYSLLFPETLKGVIVVDLAPYDYHSDLRFKVMNETEEMLKKLVKIDMGDDYKSVSESVRASANSKAVSDFVMTNIRKDEQTGKYIWKCNLNTILRNYKGVVGGLDGYGNKGFTGAIKIIFGKKSDYYAPDIMKEFQRVFTNFDEKSDLVVIEDAGHWVHFTKPYEFIEEVSSFLKILNDIKA